MRSRMYAVEITKNRKLIVQLANISASNPMEATVMALKINGYNKSKGKIRVLDKDRCSRELPGSMMIARVTLLGGTRESVSYYEVM